MTSAEAYAYNAQHLPEQMTVGNLRQIATYNAAGLLTELETGTPNSADSIATIVKTDECAYDSSNNFLTQHEIFISGNTNSGNPDYSYYYQYDSKGNIGQILQAGSSGVGYITYTYDAANQLIREANPFAGYTWIMTYDDAGNMLSRTKYEYAASYENAAGFQISEQTFTYGSEGWGDVLTSINGVGVQSDEIGNITNDGTNTYTWKNGKQLATVTSNGATWTNTYDANGMRTQRSNGSTTYTYTYDGGKLTQMKMGSSTMRFTYGINGHPVSLNYDGIVYYYVTNAQGDVVAILNSSGQEVVSYTYDAWGNTVKRSGSKADTLGLHNPLRYRSYVYDRETGLYYLQSRYYNPDICRFISADSISYLGADGTPVSYNLFVYCGNNPANVTISTTTNINSPNTTTAPAIKGTIGGSNSATPLANFVSMSNYSISLFENFLIGMALGNISHTTTFQHNTAEMFYAYSNVGNTVSSVGLGLNIKNYCGVSAYFNSSVGVGLNVQVNPFLTYGTEVSLLDGFAVSIGTISGDTSNEITLSIGWGSLAAAYAVAVSPIPGARVVAASAVLIILCSSMFIN